MTWQSSRNSLNSTRAGRLRSISPCNTRGVGNPFPFSWNPYVWCLSSDFGMWSPCFLLNPQMLIAKSPRFPYFLMIESVKSLNHWIPCLFMSVGKPVRKSSGEINIADGGKTSIFVMKAIGVSLVKSSISGFRSPDQKPSLIKHSSLCPKVTDTKGGSGGDQERLGCPGVWGELRQFNQVVFADGPFRDGLRWPKMVEDGLSPNVWPAN